MKYTILFCLFFIAVKDGFAQRKPNIVFFLVDDMGWTDLSCYGSSFYESPNIDALQKSGIKFTNAYSSCTVCSPTRAALMTGKSPARLHLTDWIEGYRKPFAKLLSPDWTMYLSPDEKTIAETLKEQNYATAIFGKWHLGDDVKYYPEKQGFDLNVAGTYQGQPPSYFSPYRIPRLKEGEPGEYLTDRLTDEAIKFIKEKQSSPFFLYMPFFAVHTPLQAKKEYVKYFKSKIDSTSNHQNPVYAAMIKSMDESVGRIVKVLQDLNLTDKTFIVFTSDNGGLLGDATWEKGRITSNAPLRAGKGSAYEGGVRVPAIFSWKGKIKPNSVSNTPIISTDLFYTLSALSGGRSAPAGNTDGINLMPVLTNTPLVSKRELYWHYPHYHPGGATPYSAIRDGNWKLIHFYETDKKELYNLKDDIGEKHDLYSAEIKIGNALYAKLDKWRKASSAQNPIPNQAYNEQKNNQNSTKAPRVVIDPEAVN